jgi:hypothetical protein
MRDERLRRRVVCEFMCRTAFWGRRIPGNKDPRAEQQGGAARSALQRLTARAGTAATLLAARDARSARARWATAQSAAPDALSARASRLFACKSAPRSTDRQCGHTQTHHAHSAHNRASGNHTPTVIANTLLRIKAESNKAQGAAQNERMDRALHAIAVALAELDGAELRSLIRAINGVRPTAPGVRASIDGIPQMAPGLLKWVAAACHWELHRRHGRDYELQPPEAMIPPEEAAVNIEAAISLRAMFPQGIHGAHALFDALAELLTAVEHKHRERNPTP